MKSFYKKMMIEAKDLARQLPDNKFYIDCADSIKKSLAIFESHEIVLLCQKQIEHDLSEDFGHGWDHSRKVGVEAGAIVIEEQERKRNCFFDIARVAALAQISGLLHDIKRKEKNHAEAGAKAAAKLLKQWPLDKKESRFVVSAILNHEAFVAPKPVERIDALDAQGRLISDALYDADKFRWGPDNFTDTLWLMAAAKNATPKSVLEHYSLGIKRIRKIKSTFRSSVGKLYGPEFIDQGLIIGKAIHQRMISAISKGSVENLQDE